MRALLTEHVPEHGVFGEEHGAVRTDAEYVWVLDPIDGTKAFITGLPIFGTLIALLHRGQPVLGVIDQPILQGALAGRRRASARPSTASRSRCAPARRSTSAYMYSTAPIMFPGAFEKTPRGADAEGEALPLGRRLLRLRPAGLGPCRPGGRESTSSSTTSRPSSPVIKGAGGLITDWQGKELDMHSDGSVLAAGDAATHRAAMDILGGAVSGEPEKRRGVG